MGRNHHYSLDTVFISGVCGVETLVNKTILFCGVVVFLVQKCEK